MHAALEAQLFKEKVQKNEIKDLEWAVGGEDGTVSLTALCVKMLS